MSFPETIYRSQSGAVEIYRRDPDSIGVVIRRPTLKGEVKALATILSNDELDRLVEAIRQKGIAR